MASPSPARRPPPPQLAVQPPHEATEPSRRSASSGFSSGPARAGAGRGVGPPPGIQPPPDDEWERREEYEEEMRLLEEEEAQRQYEEEKRIAAGVSGHSRYTDDYSQCSECEDEEGSQQETPPHPVGEERPTKSSPGHEFGSSAYPELPDEEEAAGEAPELVPCEICGRNFAADRMARHAAICAKQKKKKPKVYGPSAERLKLQEKAAEEEAKRAEEKAKKKAKWQQEHEAFQNALKSATAAAKGEAPPADLPEVEDTRVPCPHCGRKFAAETAERHIPHCAKTKNKPNAVGTAMKRPGRSSPAASESGDVKARAPATPTKAPPKAPPKGDGNTPSKPPRAGAASPMPKAGAASPSKMATRKGSPMPGMNKRPTATPPRAR